MHEWPLKTWGEVLTLQRGFDITKSEQNLDGNIPVVSSGGISSFHDTAVASGPGVVMGRKGTLGRIYFVEGDYWPHDTTLWVKDFKGNEPRFVYYALQGVDFSHMNVGTASPTLNRNHVHPMPVRWPPTLAEQRGIAATLGALDDKIESNRHAVLLTQELARALYKAPAERQRIPASDLLRPVLGGTPSRDVGEYWGGGVRWASAKDVAASNTWFVTETAESITHQGVGSSAAKILPAGTIVMTARGTVGALARLGDDMAFNQSCYGLEALDGVPGALLFLGLDDAVQRIRDAGHGTVFNTVNMATFDQIEVDWPMMSKDGVRQIESLFSLIEQRVRANTQLGVLRDTLLPELLSGRVRVSHKAESVEEVIA